MSDTPYKSEDVDAESRPIFEQLSAEFGATYQIWRRVEDFGRLVIAAVLNPSTQTAAKIIIRHGSQTRSVLGSLEIQKIRRHLTSGTKEDLVLKAEPSHITRRSKG